MTKPVITAVIPAAGLGTRFLPATKALPKEMLPVVDRPAIQHVVEEAVDAELTDVLFVVGRNKDPLVNHFDRVAELEDTLERKGKTQMLAQVQAITDLATFHYVRQREPAGLGDAVAQAAHHVRGASFAVLLGDDLIDQGGALLTEMLQVHEQTGASVVAVQPVPAEQVSSYGVIAPATEADPLLTRYGREALWVDTMVEKPAPEQAPSQLAVIGRYVLSPKVFEVLKETGTGAGGEIQLTDALVTMAENPAEYGGVVAVVHHGRRYDTGNKVEYAKANVELSLKHPQLGPELREWLVDYVHHLQTPDADSNGSGNS
ncbi:UTP--glucose-1-phosphate uridylyltransferase [Auritidibacter ignavus]|uniref:UTP--glucose-1-phosphate uridylyltransferase n=1 Tax=Auritidibacter ignavus TaxID=678932 RepID=UPI00109D22B3|nr:UTP--glucose-1-phosphate uridylyltransferase [Auritidibacter ignavus]